jgi:hypothetical protein
MNISNFDNLLQAAKQQTDAQRLLLVFASAALPDNASPEQRSAFAAGHGGELAPIMCVDKTPDELVSFASLQEEAAQLNQDWVIVFVAGLSGQGPRAPSSKDAEPHLQRMVEAIKAGQLGHLIPFNRQGDAVSLN